MKFNLFENEKVKMVRSDGYNYNFSKTTGYFERYGRTKEENPIMAPSSEILDIEISSGKCLGNCPWCYKGNAANKENKYMSFETYKKILDKFPKNKNGNYFVNQIAFGLTDVNSNKDLFKILAYTRSVGIIPNLTLSGKNICDEDLFKLAHLCGAISVSHYNDEDCFNTIEALTEFRQDSSATLKQINIHQILCVESYNQCLDLIAKSKIELKLKGLGAIVFLTMKPKGERNTLHSIIDMEKIFFLFDECKKNNVSFGSDSCGSPNVLKWAESRDRLDLTNCIESCESSLTSFYINVSGEAFPCSFAEGVGNWKTGIDLLKVKDFNKDVWFSDRVAEWRESLISSSSKCSNCKVKSECRSCPLYNITNCKHE